MKPDEKWWAALIAKSVNKTKAAITEWKEVHRRRAYDPKVRFDCICGKKGLVEVHIFENELNGNEIVIGSCCVKRFGIKVPGWRRRTDYFSNALLYARNEKEREFVSGLMHKPVRYGGLIITKKQQKWLEDITGHPYRGRVFPDRKPCPNCGQWVHAESVPFLPRQRFACPKCGKGCYEYDRVYQRRGKCCKCRNIGESIPKD
jgi:hypothetical protein